MKKYLFVMLLATVVVFPMRGAFAQNQNSPVKKSTAVSLPTAGHINAFRVDKIIGSTVINLDGERIGTIDNLVIDMDTGSIVYAALDFGGWLGIGDKLFAVPWQSLTAVPAEGIFIIDQSKAKLKKAPGFNKNDWPDVGDLSWGAGIYEFYRHHLPNSRTAAAPATPRKQERHRGYRPYPGYAPNPYPYTNAWGNVYGELFNPEKIATVKGEIVRIEYSEGLRLVIYTDAKKPVLVALGPTDYLEKQAKVLKPGDKVTVTGSRIVVDDTPLMIATKIKEGHEELRLRDNEGHPIWFGWKKIT